MNKLNPPARFLCLMLLLFVSKRLLSIYWHEHDMLAPGPMTWGTSLKQQGDPCSVAEHMNALNQASDAEGLSLLGVSFSDPLPCGHKQNCYPLTLVWESSFFSGRALMDRYQHQCYFLFKEIKVNRVADAVLHWQISGWAVEERT